MVFTTSNIGNFNIDAVEAQWINPMIEAGFVPIYKQYDTDGNLLLAFTSQKSIASRSVRNIRVALYLKGGIPVYSATVLYQEFELFLKNNPNIKDFVNYLSKSCDYRYDVLPQPVQLCQTKQPYSSPSEPSLSSQQNLTSLEDTQDSKLQKQDEKEYVRQKANEPRKKTAEEYQLEKKQKENLLRNGLSIGIALTGLLLMVASGAGLLIGMPMVVGVIYYNLVHHKVIKPIDFKKVARQVTKQVIKLSEKTIQVSKNITKQVIKLAKKVIKLVKKQVIALCANVIKHLEDSKET